MEGRREGLGRNGGKAKAREGKNTIFSKIETQITCFSSSPFLFPFLQTNEAGGADEREKGEEEGAREEE